MLLSELEVAKYVEAHFTGFALTDDERSDALRLAWKLGYATPVYDDKYKLLEERLAAFQTIVSKATNIESETERELIRSVGVNLFVSTEEFIEQLIAFNIWLLESDHYRQTNFIYCPKDAMSAVAPVLTPLASAEIECEWSSDGRNTLGSLLVYLDLTEKWLSRLLTATRRELPAIEMPHFAGRDSRIFPYKCKQLWANSNPNALIAHHKAFASVSKAIKRSGLPSIRNGIDHKRGKDDFPAISDMIEFCNHLQDALRLADQERMHPKIYWKTEFRKDRSGQWGHVLKDYKGHDITIRGPSVLAVSSPVLWSRPHVVAPGNLLGFPNSEIIFIYRETSPYVEQWSNYPSKKSGEADSTSGID